MSSSHSSSADLRWSFSSLGCPELTLAEISAVAQTRRVPRVELRAAGGRLDLPAYLDELYPDPAELRAWLKREQLEVIAFDSSAKLIDCKPEAKAELLEFARWSDALGVPNIRVFDGGTTRTELPEEELAEAASFLHWWEEQRVKNGWQVQLVIETHDSLCHTRPIEQLNERHDGEVRILWDAHHTWKKGGEDPAKTWPAIKSLVHHIHFKDSISVPSARHPFTYVHLGEGEFPLKPFIAMLKNDGFAGPVSLEWERQWHPYLDPLDLALERLDAFR